jgi:hypothetical protein
MHAYTLYGSVRPWGATMFIASFDHSGPSLWVCEPSGIVNVSGISSLMHSCVQHGAILCPIVEVMGAKVFTLDHAPPFLRLRNNECGTFFSLLSTFEFSFA